jgi:hypothetical protein
MRIEIQTELCREDSTGWELDIPVRVIAHYYPAEAGNPNIESMTCCPPSDEDAEIEAVFQIGGYEISLSREEESEIIAQVIQEAHNRLDVEADAAADYAGDR